LILRDYASGYQPIGFTLKIVETISITNDPAEPETDAMYVQVSSGYVNGQDQLTLNPVLHPTIRTSWDALAGKLKYSVRLDNSTYTDFVSAIKTLYIQIHLRIHQESETFPLPLTSQLSSINGSLLSICFVPGITLDQRKKQQQNRLLNYYGLQGYLATILSIDEAKLSGEQAGAGWIGSDSAPKEWKWVTGPTIDRVVNGCCLVLLKLSAMEY
jgi:hypothetical protein